MSTFLRTAKSASDWTNSELSAYNIVFEDVPPIGFFTTSEPSLDRVDSAILSSPPGDTNSSVSDAAASYLGYLLLALKPTDQNFVVDFAAETLKLLGFNEPCTTLVTHYTIPLAICGEENHIAQTDVSLIHTNPNVVLMVLVQDKSTPSYRCNAEARVVAAAIAAFQFNNTQRREYSLDPLEAKTLPCITMNGTLPTFYLVPVTTELSTAVATGQYPASPTLVSRCVTAVMHEGISTGMEDTKDRKMALKRFLAFKELAKFHWLPR